MNMLLLSLKRILSFNKPIYWLTGATYFERRKNSTNLLVMTYQSFILMLLPVENKKANADCKLFLGGATTTIDAT